MKINQNVVREVLTNMRIQFINLRTKLHPSDGIGTLEEEYKIIDCNPPNSLLISHFVVVV